MVASRALLFAAVGVFVACSSTTTPIAPSVGQGWTPPAPMALDLPTEIRDRAFAHAQKYWPGSQLGEFEALYRPDVHGAAYFEVEVVRDTKPVASIVLSTGRHAPPIVQWSEGSFGLRSRQLRRQAALIGQELVGFAYIARVMAAIDRNGDAAALWPIQDLNWRDLVQQMSDPNNEFAQLDQRYAEAAWESYNAAPRRIVSKGANPLVTWPKKCGGTYPPDYVPLTPMDTFNEAWVGHAESGCGATAWAMIIGWIDQQAWAGDPKWMNYGGLYHVGGVSYQIYKENDIPPWQIKDAPAPWSMSYGARVMTNRIREVLGSHPTPTGTWTSVYEMGYIGNYLADVGLKESMHWPTYHIGGAPYQGIKDNIKDFLCNQHVPAIIGYYQGAVLHYGVVYEYGNDGNGGDEYFKIQTGQGYRMPEYDIVPSQSFDGTPEQVTETGFPAPFFAGSLLPGDTQPPPEYIPSRNLGIEILYADYGDAGYILDKTGNPNDPFANQDYAGSVYEPNSTDSPDGLYSHNNAALAGIGKACNTKFDCTYTIDGSANGGYMDPVPHNYGGGASVPENDVEPFVVRYKCSDGFEAGSTGSGAWQSHLIEVPAPSQSQEIHLTCPFHPDSTSSASTDPQPDNYNWFSLPMQHIDYVTVTITAPAAFIPGYAPVQMIEYAMTGAEANSGSLSGTQGTLRVSAEGITTIKFHGVDGDGNKEPDQSITIQIDNTPPANSPVLSPHPNAAGWNNKPVTVSFSCVDALSGIATNATDVPITLEGSNQTAEGTCTDKATNSKTAKAIVNLDETPPVVSYTSNQGTYTVDQSIDITCSAADNLSGVAGYGDSCPVMVPIPSCASIGGPAYSFIVGKTANNSFQIAANDVADNCASTTTSFKVIVTYQSLCNLVQRFSTNQGTAAAVCTKLFQAQSAPNQNAKEGQFKALKNQVDAQSGKAIPSDDAAILTRLADLCLQEC